MQHVHLMSGLSSAVNIITISHGAAIGWVSPFLPYLQSSESHLTSGSVSIEQASWIGSLLCIGGMIGAPLFGLLADRFGKKLGLQLIVIPHVVSKMLRSMEWDENRMFDPISTAQNFSTIVAKICFFLA